MSSNSAEKQQYAQENALRVHATHSGPDEEESSAKRFVAIYWLVVARSVLPGLVNYLSNTHYSYYVTDVIPRSHAASVTSSLLTYILLAACAWVSVRPCRGPLPIAPLVWVAFLICAGFIAFPGAYDSHELLQLLLGLTLAFAIWRLRPRLDSLRVVAVAGSCVAGIALLFGLVDPSHAMLGDHYGRIDDSVKALIGNSQLAGPFGHSNTLGIYCVLALPFVGFARKRRYRLLEVGLLVSAIVWSASRTSLGAVAALVGYTLLRGLIGRGSGSATWARLVLVGLFAAVVILPLSVTDPADFTRRGAIWLGTLNFWSHSKILGMGPFWYSDVAQQVNSLGLEASSGHNLFVGLLGTGGIALVVLVGSTLFILARRVAKASLSKSARVVVCYFVAFAAISLFEFVWVLEPSGELFPVVGAIIFTVILGEQVRPFAYDSEEGHRSAANRAGARSDI